MSILSTYCNGGNHWQNEYEDILLWGNATDINIICITYIEETCSSSHSRTWF